MCRANEQGRNEGGRWKGSKKKKIIEREAESSPEDEEWQRLILLALYTGRVPNRSRGPAVEHRARRLISTMERARFPFVFPAGFTAIPCARPSSAAIAEFILREGARAESDGGRVSRGSRRGTETKEK